MRHSDFVECLRRAMRPCSSATGNIGALLEKEKKKEKATKCNLAKIMLQLDLGITE